MTNSVPEDCSETTKPLDAFKLLAVMQPIENSSATLVFKEPAALADFLAEAAWFYENGDQPKRESRPPKPQ